MRVVSAGVHATSVAVPSEARSGCLDLLGLGLPVVMNYHVDVVMLGIKLTSSGRTTSSLKC